MRYLLVLASYLQYVYPPSTVGSLTLIFKATKGVSTSYDALIEPFECFKHYLSRLEVLTGSPPSWGKYWFKIVKLLEDLALAA